MATYIRVKNKSGAIREISDSPLAERRECSVYEVSGFTPEVGGRYDGATFTPKASADFGAVKTDCCATIKLAKAALATADWASLTEAEKRLILGEEWLKPEHHAALKTKYNS